MQIKHKIWVWSSMYVHNGGEWLQGGPFEQYIQKYVSSQLLWEVLLFFFSYLRKWALHLTWAAFFLLAANMS